MANKRKYPKKRDQNTLEVQQQPGEDQAQTLAKVAVSPTVHSAVTIKEFTKHIGDVSIMGLIHTLADQVKSTQAGDLKRAEAMLTTQAHTLDTIFNTLAQRAIRAEYVSQLEAYLKLALRAQSQCRATLETLATIKNPPPVSFVRQANIAHGPQQVNNAPNSVTESPRARENLNVQNKLLEQNDGERLEFGTPGTAGRADPAMAAVGEVNGTQDEAG